MTKPLQDPILAKLQDLVGQELGISPWLLLDQARIQAFAECTEDHQWLHVDEQKAAAGPFGSTIAHGFLTLALLTKMQRDANALPRDIPTVINYGLDRVRFLAPVRADSYIRDRVTLLAARPKSPSRLLITTRNTVEIKGEPSPALIADALTLLVSE